MINNTININIDKHPCANIHNIGTLRCILYIIHNTMKTLADADQILDILVHKQFARPSNKKYGYGILYAIHRSLLSSSQHTQQQQYSTNQTNKKFRALQSILLKLNRPACSWPNLTFPFFCSLFCEPVCDTSLVIVNDFLALLFNGFNLTH